ncbi:hypothetical protein MNBD_DELTA03-609 [hydrothermal vent metagenome]|uniref:Cytochrome c7-like domain-containing protein n=1 Tax=hydrothermal vent metagenome TaxID=652676 RepID=A0A3B0VM06_9ZZZZ
MNKEDGAKKIAQTAVMVFVVALALCLPGGNGTVAQAASGAKHATNEAAAAKVRAEAAKALLEAQNAMDKADEMMRMAQKQRQKSMSKEKDAFQKMVAAGYYPSDITLTAQNGQVHAVFSHRKHLLREHLKCTECHPRIFIMNAAREKKKKGFTMANMRKGLYCGHCHNGKRAFSVADLAMCKRCHPKQL